MIFIQHLSSNPAFYFSWVFVVIFSICLHEFSHAWVAYRQGDSTALEHGYLSLNPLRVMGVQSLIALALFGIAWGAVPVDPRRGRHKLSQTLISLAGPMANAMLAISFTMLCRIAIILPGADSGLAESLVFFTNVAAQANWLLLVFNLLPIPMLDGWAVIEILVPRVREMTQEQRSTYSFIAIMLLWFSPMSRYIFMLATHCQAVVFDLIGFIPGLS